MKLDLFTQATVNGEVGADGDAGSSGVASLADGFAGLRGVVSSRGLERGPKDSLQGAQKMSLSGWD